MDKQNLEPMKVPVQEDEVFMDLGSQCEQEQEKQNEVWKNKEALWRRPWDPQGGGGPEEKRKGGRGEDSGKSEGRPGGAGTHS